MEKKVLVAVFSASGVTKRVGEKIAEISGGDFFEIVPEEKYTSADLNYMNSKSRSSVEMKDPSARPKVAGVVADMDAYDTVIIGFPIWWESRHASSRRSSRATTSPARPSSRSARQAEAASAAATQRSTRTPPAK